MKAKKLNEKKVKIVIILVVCATTLGIAATALAKYVARQSKNMALAPSAFYFSSNYLKESNPSYNIYKLENAINIELYNSSNLNKSEIDIPFEVTVTNGTSDIVSGTISTDEEKKIIHITPNDNSNQVSVSVKSKNYECILSADFIISEIGDKSYYTFTDKGNYSELAIMTSSDIADAITVNWSAGYTPDTANPLINSWTGTSGILESNQLERNSMYIIMFMKDENLNHTVENATVITDNSITLP